MLGQMFWVCLEMSHIPVLLKEVLAQLSPEDKATYLDATFGGGGYTQALLEAAACRVIALDRDPDAGVRAKAMAGRFPGRFQFILTPFSRLEEALACVSELSSSLRGAVFDFGVSSFQLDTPERGFSFQKDGPLDMRMEAEGVTAADVVNTFSQQDLTEILLTYGEEPRARQISQAITTHRKQMPIKTTSELAEIVRSVVPRLGILDPATKTFQAIRMFINDELREIQSALEALENLVLKSVSDLRVVTVAFHALEDRVVKNWIRKLSMPNMPVRAIAATRHVIKPSEAETKMNVRSRSGRLRAVTLQRS